MFSRSFWLTTPDRLPICAMLAIALLIIAGLLRPRSTVAVDATLWQDAQVWLNFVAPATGSADQEVAGATKQRLSSITFQSDRLFMVDAVVAGRWLVPIERWRSALTFRSTSGPRNEVRTAMPG